MQTTSTISKLMPSLSQSDYNLQHETCTQKPILTPESPLPNPLPIHLDLHSSQVDRPTRTRLLHPRRQPGLGLPVVERPLGHDEDESEDRAAETDVESFVNVLGAEADDHGEDAGRDEEEGGEEVG